MTEVRENVSFQTSAVATREGAFEVYVAGLTANNLTTIEKWTYPVRDGGYRIESTNGPRQPIGTPMTPYTAQEILNGPAFVPPATGRHAKANREAFFLGNTLGVIRSMAVDPEGRFLLALTYPSGKIYRLGLIGMANPGGPPSFLLELLYTPTEIPHLVNAATVSVEHHVTEGREYVISDWQKLSDLPDPKYTVLSDSDNDGVFESFVTLNTTQWLASEYSDTNKMTLYENLGVTFDWGN